MIELLKLKSCVKERLRGRNENGDEGEEKTLDLTLLFL